MKSYCYQIGSNFIFSSILVREKTDIIKILINTISYLSLININYISDSSDLTIVIKVDKMSRLFFCTEDKIHTFQLPFILKEEDSKLKFYYQDFEIDSKMIAILLTLFENLKIMEVDLEKTMESIFDTATEYEMNNTLEYTSYLSLINHLILFEPGYVRYDYDISREV